MFVLVVSLTVHPDGLEEFRAGIAANAEHSVRDEPGCRRFDVVALEDPGLFLLYEWYDDAAAFAAHQATPHFAAWRAIAERVVAEQVNRSGTLLAAGGEG